jgi:hypothetical protein
MRANVNPNKLIQVPGESIVFLTVPTDSPSFSANHSFEYVVPSYFTGSRHSGIGRGFG